MRSAAEQEIRDAAIARLRLLRPGARIVHELNVDEGKNRIDVAAIDRHEIFAVEIKSERDTCNRLADQVAAFAACAHYVIVAAHVKHWSRSNWQREDLPPMTPPAGVRAPRARRGLVKAWRYPREGGDNAAAWEAPKPSIAQPHAHRMLGLLWREELKELCAALRVAHPPRARRDDLITALIWRSNGEELARGVCRALRARSFAEADEPILELSSLARPA